MKLLNRPSETFEQKVVREYGAYFSRMRALARWLPDPLACEAAAWIGANDSPRRYEKPTFFEQLGRCDFGLTASEQADFTEYQWKRFLRHAGINALNTYRYARLNHKRFQNQFEIEGEALLANAHAQGRGVLLLTNHHHHLLLMLSAVGLLGYPTFPLLYDPDATTPSYMVEHMNKTLQDSESQFHGGRYLQLDFKTTFVRPLFKVLDAGHILISTNDIPASLAPKRRLEVPFLGQSISLPMGSVEMAIKKNSPVLTVFIRWLGANRFVLKLSRIDAPTVNGVPPSAAEIVSRYGQALEAEVLHDPAAWEAWKWPDLFDIDPI